MRDPRSPVSGSPPRQGGGAGYVNPKDKREAEGQEEETINNNINSGSCTPCANEETESEPLFAFPSFSPEECSMETDPADEPGVEHVKTYLMPVLQQALLELLLAAYEHGSLQASIQALHKARRAALEKKEAAEDQTQTDPRDVCKKTEESSVDPETEKRQAAPGGFQPLLALAEILQRMSETQKAEPATATAQEARAEDARELETQEDNAVT